MQSILDNLYYGNLCPSEKPLIPGSPAEKAHAAFNDAAIQLEQTLSGTEKELFEAFADANQELCEFSDGFRLGSQMMLEILQDEFIALSPPKGRHSSCSIL